MMPSSGSFSMINPNLQLPPAPGQGFQNYFEIDVNESIQSVLFSVSNYLREGERVAKELVEIKFKELLLNLVLNQKNHALGAYFNAVRNERQDLEYTMRKNFLHDLSMEQFARLCGKSLSAFKRDFTEHFGSSPGKWLTEMRLNHAKGLLLTTSLSINEVCYDSGFKNPSHFSRAFKQQFGVAPQSLRDRAA
ncbi:MAG: helix-turn-helix transcriptional regulator [Bacteroidetes bacterium]|nr:helix-turn-helix transcriptional regulator [Bacteroidota bacterium]